MWIDHQGRLRRMVIGFPFSRTAVRSDVGKDAPRSMTEVVRLTMSHYGVAVHATPPPASEVRPLPSTPTTVPAS